MEDTFKELTPEEIKLATIQFMGQHLTGEMKELNKNIIGESTTLRSLSIDPVKVLQTVPGGTNPYATTVNAGINVIPRQNTIAPTLQPQIIPNQTPQIFNDPNQLEFDFNNSNYAKTIFERLDSIDRKLDKILQKNT